MSSGSFSQTWRWSCLSRRMQRQHHARRSVSHCQLFASFLTISCTHGEKKKLTLRQKKQRQRQKAWRRRRSEQRARQRERIRQAIIVSRCTSSEKECISCWKAEQAKQTEQTSDAAVENPMLASDHRTVAKAQNCCSSSAVDVRHSQQHHAAVARCKGIQEAHGSTYYDDSSAVCREEIEKWKIWLMYGGQGAREFWCWCSPWA